MDDLIIKVFGFDKDEYRRTYAHPDHRLVANDAGFVYANVSVFVRDVALDKHRHLDMVKIGWIAQVCTDEDRRGEGIATKLIGDAEFWLARQRVPFAALHTADTRLYDKLGYVPAPNLPGPGTAMVKPIPAEWPARETITWREGW